MLHATVHEVHFSPAGSTKKAVSEIGRCFSSAPVVHDFLRGSGFAPVELAENDLLIVGSPVFGGRVPVWYAEHLTQFSGRNTPAIIVVTYGNREYEDALCELYDLLSSRGFCVFAAGAVAAMHSIFSDVGAGRPDTEDLIALRSFAADAAEKLNNISDVEQATVDVPGNRPYLTPAGRKFDFAVSTACVQCGQCAAICPVDAISTEDAHVRDTERCMLCTACLYVCPNTAISFSDDMFTGAKPIFLEKFSARKEGEYFL